MPLLTGKSGSRSWPTSSSSTSRESIGTSRLRLRVICWKSAYFALSVPGGHRAKERGKPFCHRRVDQDRIAQRREGLTGGHRGLDDRHDCASLGGEGGEAQDAVAVGGDQSLVKAARFGERPGAYERGHGYLRQPVGNPATPCLRLAQADAGQFGVGE